jgi:hypothetical protein
MMVHVQRNLYKAPASLDLVTICHFCYELAITCFVCNDVCVWSLAPTCCMLLLTQARQAAVNGAQAHSSMLVLSWLLRPWQARCSVCKLHPCPLTDLLLGHNCRF